MLSTLIPDVASLPSFDRYGFPVEVCGRCGGTGKHSYNQRHGDVCYGCDGKKVRHTKKAHKHFQAWAHDLKKLRQAIGHSLQVGDELALLEPLDAMRSKIVGWHTVTSLVKSEEPDGWSISIDANRQEVWTPNSWKMTVTFDDGDTLTCSTNSIFRRKGWIDPAPYVASSMPGRQRKMY